jgi:BolA protein
MCVTDPANKELTGENSAASRIERIRVVLTQRFAPASLEIFDDSGLHAGHAGAHPGEATHVRVRMCATEFAGLSRVARQRAVNEALAQEFALGLHALALDLSAPQTGR